MPTTNPCRESSSRAVGGQLRMLGLDSSMRMLSWFGEPACGRVTQQSQCHADVFSFGQLLPPGVARSGARKRPVAPKACVARDIGGSDKGATFVVCLSEPVHFFFKADQESSAPPLPTRALAE